MKIYITRDASVTYVADVPVGMTLEEAETHCGKYGWTGPDLEWDPHSTSTYDNVEAYEIADDHENSLKEWTLG